MIEIISKFNYIKNIDIENTKLKKYDVFFVLPEESPFYNLPETIQFFTLNGEYFIYISFLNCILMPESNTITINDILNNEVNRTSWRIQKIDREPRKDFTLNLKKSLEGNLYLPPEISKDLNLKDYRGFLNIVNLVTGEELECYYYDDDYDYFSISFEDMNFPIDINTYGYKKDFIKAILEWMKI